MKLGVICVGISQDLDETVTVMDTFALEFAELQSVETGIGTMVTSMSGTVIWDISISRMSGSTRRGPD